MQELQDKVSEVELILKEPGVDCFCVNEHWLFPDEYPLIKIVGYITAVSFWRTVSIEKWKCEK